jgi:SAM-dependent methyltransferase
LALFDPLAERYDAWFDEAGKEIFALEVDAFKQLLPELPKPWFEIGIGSGRFAQALGIPWGIDPSTKLADMARARGIKVIQGVGENLPISDDLLGSVFLIVTLCFVDDPGKVISEARRVLKDGGYLVAGIVPAEFPWGRYYQEQGEGGHPFYSHARFFVCTDLITLLKEHGFHLVKKVSTLFSAPGEKLSKEIREGYHPDAGFVVLSAQLRRGTG